MTRNSLLHKLEIYFTTTLTEQFLSYQSRLKNHLGLTRFRRKSPETEQRTRLGEAEDAVVAKPDDGSSKPETKTMEDSEDVDYAAGFYEFMKEGEKPSDTGGAPAGAE